MTGDDVGQFTQHVRRLLRIDFSGVEDATARVEVERVLAGAGWRVRTYADGDTFFSMHDSRSGGCLVIDVSRPCTGGLEIHTRLRSSCCSLPVVMISAKADVATVVAAMKRGAVDFLEKPLCKKALLQAVAAAVRLCEKQRSESQRRHEVDRCLAALIRKEIDVLELLVEGLLNKQIAARLDVSVRTVELRRSRILRIMQLGSVGELTCLLVRAHRVHFHDAAMNHAPVRFHTRQAPLAASAPHYSLLQQQPAPGGPAMWHGRLTHDFCGWDAAG